MIISVSAHIARANPYTALLCPTVPILTQYHKVWIHLTKKNLLYIMKYNFSEEKPHLRGFQCVMGEFYPNKYPNFEILFFKFNVLAIDLLWTRVGGF